MVLLQYSKNTLIGNSSSAEKKEVLKGSTFTLTAQVAKYKTRAGTKSTSGSRSLLHSRSKRGPSA
jgi:hypothetical protein